MKIFIQCRSYFGENVHSIEINASDTIGMVKLQVNPGVRTEIRQYMRLQVNPGVRTDIRQFFFDGKELEDGHTIAYYNIKNGSTIASCVHLMMTFAGAPEEVRNSGGCVSSGDNSRAVLFLSTLLFLFLFIYFAADNNFYFAADIALLLYPPYLI